MKPTLKDIAALAGVSTAAVSIILNKDNNRFSDETKIKVKSIAKELNYTPNIAAKNLVSRKSNTIGLIIPDIGNPFFSTLAKIIENSLRSLDYTLIIVNANEDYKNDIDLIRFLESRNVDGLLIALSANSYGKEAEVRSVLESIKVPYVLMDRVVDGFDCNQVIFNDKKGSYLATKHAIDMGHTKIGMITTSKNALSGYYRHCGYEKALIEHSIDIDNNIIAYGTYDFESGYELSEELINNGSTVIIAANDLIAFGAIKRARELNKTIPEDISIIGYDNLEIGSILEVELTSVYQNIDNLAEESLKILFDVMNNSKDIKKIVLEPKLIVGTSVCKIIKEC